MNAAIARCLNESPSEKEGKSKRRDRNRTARSRLNESPSEKEGKYPYQWLVWGGAMAGLNESPSEKEGKSRLRRLRAWMGSASMKALPKRKGNGLREMNASTA